MQHRHPRLRVTLMGLGAVALWIPPVFAQNVQTSPSQEDEIIVTAQRRAQSIQDVPLAVTAFDQSKVDSLQLSNAADLQLVVPNFAYTPTNFGGVNYTIRGIGASVLGDGADTGVALHYNGAFLQGGGNASLYYDVAAVEVLRGPQGTLFGRNATGGAVNLRTQRPTDEHEGLVEITASERNGRTAEVMYNLPVSDALAFRLAAVADHDDGDVRNLTSGERINGGDVFSARASMRLDVGGTEVNASATFLRATGDGMQAEARRCLREPIGNLGCSPDRLAAGAPNFLGTLQGLIAVDVGLVTAGSDPFAASVFPTDLRTVALDFEPRVFSQNWIGAVELEHAFNALTLTSLTAFATEDGFYETDTDFAVASGQFRSSTFFPGGPVPASRPDPANLGSLAGRTQGSFTRPWTFERAEGQSVQWSQEVRLASSLDGPFNFLLGAFYLDFDRKEDFFQIATPLDAAARLLRAAPPFFRLETPVTDLVSYAAFGEAYWAPVETVRLTAGLRWTHDEKRQVNRSLLLNLPAPFDSNKLEDEALTGRAVLEWTPVTDATLLYASYSRGYKGGGFNPQGAVAVAPTFDPEFVDAFEVGAKSRLFDVATLNLAGFRYDYDGLQVSKIVNRTSVNENIDATIWGAEFELNARIGDRWAFDASVGHLKTDIAGTSSIDPRDPTGGRPGFIAIKDTQTGGNCVATFAQLFTLLGGEPFGDCAALGLPDGNPVNLDGNELANAPEWTVKIGAQYERPLGGSLLARARLDYAWRSDFWGRIFNRYPIDRIEGWGALNAQLELRGADLGWYVRLEGENVLDEDAVTGMFVTDASSGLATNLFLLPARKTSLVIGTRF